MTVELLNSNDEVVDACAGGTVFPFAVVTDAVDLLVEADCAGFCYAGLGSVEMTTGLERYTTRS